MQWIQRLPQFSLRTNTEGHRFKGWVFEVEGVNFMEDQLVKNEDVCIEECRKRPDCAALTYINEEKRCNLMSANVGSKVAESSPHVFSMNKRLRVVRRVFSQNLVDERGVPPGPLERYRKFPILSRSLVMT
eukprot:sb/3475019/